MVLALSENRTYPVSRGYEGRIRTCQPVLISGHPTDDVTEKYYL